MTDPMSESDVQEQIQTAASRYGNKLWRNNVGAFEDRTGRTVFFGLGNISKLSNKQFKTSDLIGFTMVTITPDMIGKKLPVFTAIECKKPSWKYAETIREVGQKKFIDVVRMNNGIASFANSVESYAKEILNFKPR